MYARHEQKDGKTGDVAIFVQYIQIIRCKLCMMYSGL